MTQLPTIRPELPPLPSVPVPMAPDLDLALSSLSNAMAGGRTLPVDRALSPALRERLAIRADMLAGWMAPCEPDVPPAPDRPGKPGPARVMVAALLAVLPVQGSKGSAGDAEQVQKLYLRALGGLPRFALRAACSTAMTHGLGGNRKFAPSPAELRAEAEQEASRWRAEADKVRRVLEAKLEAPRPSDDVRRASAAAARRAFGLPEGGLGSGQVPHAPAGPGSVGEVARKIFADTSIDAWRRKQAAAAGPACPEDRFADAGHADGEAA